MIVTGDRDAYQLADDGSVRVMTTSRGITDTRVYDREGVIERYGDPAGAGARLHRAEGRHLRQHPGRPGHRRQDRRPAAAAVRVARGGARAHRRDLGREAAARTCARTPTWRASRRSSRRCSATSTPGIDVTEIAGQQPDRSRLREVFTRFELRDPLRRLEEALGEEEAAPRARGRAARRGARRARASLGDLATLADGRGGAGGRARGRRRALGGVRGGDEVLVGAARDACAALLAGVGRPAAGRARLEGDQPRRRAAARRARRRGARARAPRPRHDGGRLPDRPGAAPATRSTS